MGLYGDKKDYETLFKENMDKARILFEITEENRQKALELLKEKESVMEKNGFFANFQLSIINKKLNKLKKDEFKKKRTLNYIAKSSYFYYSLSFLKITFLDINITILATTITSAEINNIFDTTLINIFYVSKRAFLSFFLGIKYL